MDSDLTNKLTTILPREDDHVRLIDAHGKRRRNEKKKTLKPLTLTEKVLV